MKKKTVVCDPNISLHTLAQGHGIVLNVGSLRFCKIGTFYGDMTTS